MEEQAADYLVVGGGVAGLQAAISASAHGTVLVANKGQGCSPLAQGGLAVALEEPDRGRGHIEDTLLAGKGECDPEAVSVMVREGPARVNALIAWGARFDRGPDGGLALAREGAHRRRRILRAGGDATGREIVRALEARARGIPAITWWGDHFASELLVAHGRVVGALLLGPDGTDSDGPTPVVVAARAVLLAAGGAGQVYRRTTNPPSATGDGIAMARRAGAELRHMEFVQFHPTTLAEPYPPFLLTEAMRGEGARLVNARGEAFMKRYHPMGDLAPRDDVARAIWHEMRATGVPHVFLDATGFPPEELRGRFPTVTATCADLGLDLAAEPAPVAPSAHFMMGGVRVDAGGRSTVPGLIATGEVACSGVHGANRLASNSLLEALVFGARAGEGVAADRGPGPDAAAARAAAEALTAARGAGRGESPARVRRALQARMSDEAGLVRNGRDLTRTLRWIEAAFGRMRYDPLDAEAMECLNLLTVAREIARAALARPRSVGAHFRSDEAEQSEAAGIAG
jgi:L-aspartate oxidase